MFDILKNKKDFIVWWSLHFINWSWAAQDSPSNPQPPASGFQAVYAAKPPSMAVYPIERCRVLRGRGSVSNPALGF